MEKIREYLKLISGFALALMLAAVSQLIESILPIHLIGASVIALFLGMVINYFWKPTEIFWRVHNRQTSQNQLEAIKPYFRRYRYLRWL